MFVRLVRVLMVTLANAGTSTIVFPSCAGTLNNGGRGGLANLLGFELSPQYCRALRPPKIFHNNSFYIHSYSLDAFHIDYPEFVRSG